MEAMESSFQYYEQCNNGIFTVFSDELISPDLPKATKWEEDLEEWDQPIAEPELDFGERKGALAEQERMVHAITGRPNLQVYNGAHHWISCTRHCMVLWYNRYLHLFLTSAVQVVQ